MLAGRLQRRTTTLATRMEDAFRVRLRLPSAPGAGAALCQGLRASSRRSHRPNGQTQQSGRTQNWIKPGGKVKNNQLMSERGILSLKPDLRLEQRGQHGQDKPDEPDHRGNLAESSLNKPELGFRYTHPLRQNIRPFAGFRLQIPVSLDRRQDLGSFYARCRTPFAVHDVRRLSACLGAQHSCRGGTTLFDHVSHDEWT